MTVTDELRVLADLAELLEERGVDIVSPELLSAWDGEEMRAKLKIAVTDFDAVDLADYSDAAASSESRLEAVRDEFDAEIADLEDAIEERDHLRERVDELEAELEAIRPENDHEPKAEPEEDTTDVTGRRGEA